MPARDSHLPTHLERSGLQKLIGIPELPAAKLRPVGGADHQDAAREGLDRARGLRSSLPVHAGW
jgi:hypothetical protein